MKRTALAAFALVLMSQSAWAGIEYRSLQRIEPEKGKPIEMIVQGWIEGQKAKVLFEKVDANPMLKPGNYLIADGETILLVDPENESYGEFNTDQLLALGAGALEAMQGVVDIKVENPSVERVASGPGEPIHGVDTDYLEILTKYAMTTKVLGFRSRSEVEMRQKIWSTREAMDEGLGVWFSREPPRIGIEGLDELLAEEYEKARTEGFPIQQEVETITRTYKKNGKLRDETRSKQHTMMLAWSRADVGDGTFVIPEHFRRVDYDPTLAGEPDSGSEKNKKKLGLKKLFKRN